MNYAWLSPLTSEQCFARQARRGRFYRSSRSAAECASALFSGLVKDLLAPAWLGQAMKVANALQLHFMRPLRSTEPFAAYLDAAAGDLEHPSHLIKVRASRQWAKLRDGHDWLLRHRSIARHEWPEIRAIYLVVDTSGRCELPHVDEAVGDGFEFRLEALEDAFSRDEVPIVQLDPQDLLCFGMVKRIIDTSKFELLQALKN